MKRKRKRTGDLPTLRTYSGVTIADLTKVSPEDIRTEDIAHGLANVCRFSGQTPHFYSVAAHSILVSEWIEQHGGTPLEALCGLFHDASEAYIADLPSPAKRLCPDYKRLEERFMQAISIALALPYPPPAIVKDADRAVLMAEKLARDTGVKMPWSDKNCKAAFLTRLAELSAAPEVHGYLGTIGG